MVRQTIRLRESRRPDTYDDQKTPAEILQAEAVATSLEDLTQYLLSQIRQVHGEDKWNSPITQSLKSLVESQNTLQANCLASDSIGDCVYGYQLAVGGVYQMTKADPNDEAKMPASGIILSKSDSTTCIVQTVGLVEGLYGGMDLKRPLYVDVDGGLTQDLPAPGPGDRLFVQTMGIPIDNDAFILNPNTMLSRRRG